MEQKYMPIDRLESGREVVPGTSLIIVRVGSRALIIQKIGSIQREDDDHVLEFTGWDSRGALSRTAAATENEVGGASATAMVKKLAGSLSTKGPRFGGVCPR